MKKILRSFGYAFKGVRYAYTTQLNFKVHAAGVVIAVACGIWLHVSVYGC
nr:diacylglycerol kinase [Mucilaginibacter limnophilus]